MKSASGNLRKALADRLMLSEAMDAVTKLVAAFPNGGAQAGRSYLGALASILVTYPKIVALECADPLRGIARETKFLPTVADIVGWCEHKTQDMRGPIEREDRDARFARERAERAAAEARRDAERPHRPTIDELRAKYGPNWGIKDPGAKHVPTKEESREALIAQIGQAAFDAIPDAGWDWKRDGDWVKAEFPPGKMPPSEVAP